MSAAHIIVFVNTTKSPPTVVRAGVFSHDAGEVTTDQRTGAPLQLATVNVGQSYDENRRLAFELIRTHPLYTWVRTLL